MLGRVLSWFGGELAASISWDGIVLAGVGGLLAVPPPPVAGPAHGAACRRWPPSGAAADKGGRGFNRWSWVSGAALLAAQTGITLWLNDRGTSSTSA